MKSISKFCMPILLSSLGVACASTKVVPRPLADARAAYTRASSNASAAQLAPVQLHMAQQALANAEKAYQEYPQSLEAADLAYIAERKAQLAEATSGIELAKQEKTRSEKELYEAQSRVVAQTSQELRQTREDLNKARLESKTAMEQLTTLKDSVKQDDRGYVITVSSNVMFAPGKATLRAGATSQLDEVAQALKSAKDQRVQIEGFTDSTGSDQLNTSLSQRRAEAVLDYLAERGIDRDRLRAIGRGKTQPIADNTTPEGRASNRRVEIVVRPERAAQR